MSIRLAIMFETKTKNYAVICPHCDDPHHYIELKFPAVNDSGTWLIKCNKCGEPFAVDLKNPIESPTGNCRVIERFDDEENPYKGPVKYSIDKAVYKLAINDEDPTFTYDIHPIYCCSETDLGLEVSALQELSDAFGDITRQWGVMQNQYLARRLPDVDHLVVSIKVPCSCSQDHLATFYCPFRLDLQNGLAIEDMLLANITGVNLDDVLSGIHTKSYLMDALDKLIVRWRLYKDLVLIAAPFVGHQYKTKRQRLEIWERLLKQLDPKRTVFLTRSATWTGYKSALSDSGLDHEVLEKYGLGNQIVSTGNKKQDFHAKVYVGIGEQSEIFSGSANLVSGPSMENASFAFCSHSQVLKKYLKPLKLSLPDPPERPSHHLCIGLTKEGWRGSIESGPAPAVTQAV